MTEIGIGVIGWGFMGRTHTFGAMNMPLFYDGLPFKARLAAVCSRRMESALQAQQELGFAFATDDYHQLLAREDVQAVSICTPNNLHEEMVLAALKAGKHVYVDKPLSITYDSARIMAEAAEQSGVVNQMAFHNPFFPCVKRAKELIEEGRLGRIVSFRVEYLHSGSIGQEKPIGWKSNAEICGAGVLFDLGAHTLQMLEHLAGPIAKLTCRTQVLYPSRIGKDGKPIAVLGDDAAYMLCELQNGAMGTMEVSKIATGASDVFRAEINGEKGAIRFDLMDPNWLYFYDNTLPERPLGGERGWLQIETVGRYPKPGGSFLPSKNAVGWVRAHADCYYNFLNCVYTGRKAWPSLKDGARNQYLLQRALDSAESGAWVDTSEV